MKTLRRLCAALVLTLALTLSAFAGDMPTGITSPPPESHAMATGQLEPDVAGDMSTGVITTDPATEVMLSLLDSLLSLF